MSWSIRIPSKTFLVGEYCVLRGGPGLLLATRPDFRLTVQEGTALAHSFPPASPAGQYINEHRGELGNLQMQFEDPHLGLGGFGASSAQLLALLCLRQKIRNPLAAAQKILAEYMRHCEKHASPNSGADMMAQVAGRTVQFQSDPFLLKPVAWNLPNIDFVLLRTGVKVPTHLHVRGLANFNIQVPRALVLETQYALDHGLDFDVVKGVRDYRDWLRSQHFEFASTTEILSQMQQSGLILTGKGCGAMGADVIVALVRKEETETFRKWATERRLRVIATSKDLAPGAEVTVQAREGANP